jgi:hypothetical protein
MSFNALPDEILLEIFGWVRSDHNNDYNDYNVYLYKSETMVLCQLALCSRRLTSLSTPILYETFVCDEPRVTKQFLHRLLRMPALANHVKKFFVLESFDRNMQQESILEGLDLYRTAIEEVGLDKTESEAWFKDVTAGDWDASAALLLTICPNLDEIYLSEWCECKWVKRILMHSESAKCRENVKKYLGKVRKVTVRDMTQIPQNAALADIICLLRLGRVESADFGRVYFFDWIPQLPLPGICSLEHLRSLYFRLTDMDSDILGKLLRCCPNLQDFGIQHFCDFPRARAGLSKVKRSLEQLRVKIEHHEDCSPAPFGSLVEFEALRVLKMDAVTLLGGTVDLDGDCECESDGVQLVNILPASLESLQIYHGYRMKSEVIRQQVADLLAVKETVTPLLRMIEIQNIQLRSDYVQSAWDDLKETYKAVGIDLVLAIREDSADLNGDSDEL